MTNSAVRSSSKLSSRLMKDLSDSAGRLNIKIEDLEDQKDRLGTLVMLAEDLERKGWTKKRGT